MCASLCLCLCVDIMLCSSQWIMLTCSYKELKHIQTNRELFLLLNRLPMCLLSASLHVSMCAGEEGKGKATK